MTCRASSYDNGEGVAEDNMEAVRWYRLAAEQGNAAAQYRLGIMLATGAGVRENDIEAVRWYRLAAAQGLAIAQGALGLMYASGQGVFQNDARAYVWFNLATAASTGDARANLAKMRDTVSARLGPDQRAAMQKLAAACQASGFKHCGEPRN